MQQAGYAQDNKQALWDSLVSIKMRLKLKNAIIFQMTDQIAACAQFGILPVFN
jgi:hypothetical protein